MSQARIVKEKIYDIRIKDKKLAINEISQSDFDSYMKALPDDSDKMMTIERYEENLKKSQDSAEEN